MNSPIEKVDCCVKCKKQLNSCEEIHAVEGMLYCSKECAINAHIEFIMNCAKELACKWYNDYAEVISPADIGLQLH